MVENCVDSFLVGEISVHVHNHPKDGIYFIVCTGGLCHTESSITDVLDCLRFELKQYVKQAKKQEGGKKSE